MELREFLSALRSRWMWPIGGLLVGLGVALSLSLASAPVYSSQTQFFVTAGTGGNPVDALSANQLAARQVASYAQLLSGQQLAERVIARLDSRQSPGTFVSHLTVDVPTDTTLINVTVAGPSAAQAQHTASVLGDEFINTVRQVDLPGPGVASSITVVRTQDATLPGGPSSPRPVRNALVGLLAGLLIGCVVAAVRARLDGSIRDLATMSEAMGAPALGFVTRDKETAAHGLVARGSHSRAAEGFRQLRNELQLLNSGDSPRTIMVASAVPGAGTSTVVANLAATLAAAGKAVAVVDADLRRPALASVFGMADEPGLTDVISGDADVAAALQRTQGGRLAVLASGTGAEIPDEVLASEKMALLLRTLRAEHDVVLIDAPALLPVADAGVLAARVDGVVLCVRYGKTTVDQVRMSRHILDRVGGHTLGAVMNVVPRRVIKRWGARPYRMTSGRTRTATAPLPETQPAERRTAAAR